MLASLEQERRRLLSLVAELVDGYLKVLPARRVAPVVTPADIRNRLASYDFASAVEPKRLVEDSMELLAEWTVHTGHPGYFGLFNPASTFMGILGDTLIATVNPQLAVWSHAPAANEIERHVLRFVGARMGFEADEVAGSFTTGGAEANLTAVLLALTRCFPGYAERGLRELHGDPVLYASADSHLAWLKIAHIAGLGRDNVRLVPTRTDLRMDVDALERQVQTDRIEGRLPFLIVGTAGTTGTGVVDPLPEVGEVAERLGLRFHVDAAWGGAVALSDRLRGILAGIENAQSVTVDAHKWLSVPMGAGMFLCTDEQGLYQTFRVTTAFMPGTTPGTTDPYVHSIQWSRRSIGFKVFLSLAAAGRTGYAAQIENDCALGDVLRTQLRASGWTIANPTPLPVVCFADPAAPEEAADEFHRRVAERVVEHGRAWVSTTPVRGKTILRACVTSFRTTEDDIRALVGELDSARRELRVE